MEQNERSIGRKFSPWLLFIVFLCQSSCSLILSFDEGSMEEQGDASVDGGMNAELCEKFEPNNAVSDAIEMEFGSHAAAICPGADRDFYSFQLTEGAALQISVAFKNGQSNQGDLDINLYDGSGSIVAMKSSVADVESFEFSDEKENRLPGGKYILEIFGFNAMVTNDYTMTLEQIVPE